MAVAKPWLTSNSLIDTIKRKISFPVSQSTFTTQDILAFANEEMLISQVPSVMMYHEEYFVFSLEVPLKAGVSRYAIPDRAIGLKMRDLFYKDISGNLNEMARVSPEDKGYWQNGDTTMSTLSKFYLEGNDVVLTSMPNGSIGSLVFSIFLRPNQLVDDARACTSKYFVKNITCTGVVTGNSVTIGSTKYVAGTDFAVGANDTATATNLSNAIATGTDYISGSSTNVVMVKYTDLTTSITSDNTHIVVASTQGIEFDQVPATYIDPVTLEEEILYYGGAMIDFLQTKPGHRTHSFDVQIPLNGVAGNIITFAAGDVPDTFIIGDYVCLSNECIIPQIPPDLHNSLAERACARILAAIGDTQGAQATMQKIQENDQRQGTLIDSRVDGAPKKITGRKGLYRYGKRY